MTARLYPVWGFENPSKPTVAVFFTWSDAVSFIQSDERTLFLGQQSRDTRSHGYRPAERDWRAEYLAWCDDADNRLTEVSGDPMRKAKAA